MFELVKWLINFCSNVFYDRIIIKITFTWFSLQCSTFSRWNEHTKSLFFCKFAMLVCLSIYCVLVHTRSCTFVCRVEITGLSSFAMKQRLIDSLSNALSDYLYCTAIVLAIRKSLVAEQFWRLEEILQVGGHSMKSVQFQIFCKLQKRELCYFCPTVDVFV